MKFAELDDCAVPEKLIQEMREVKRLSGATLQSCDRSNAAEPILHKNGKHSQEELYAMAQAGTGNPANRPGTSTHERRSDGVAYSGPVGRLLFYWQVGQDWSIAQVPAVIRAWANLGWRAVVTYPTSTRERQHVNVVHKGREFKPFVVLKQGSSGTRVAWIRYALGFVHDPDDNQAYLEPRYRKAHIGRAAARKFDGHLESALKRYQHDHHQKADGVYGRQTAAQLKTTVRHRRRKLAGK